MLRILNGVLFLAALAGVVLAVRTGLETNQLRAEHQLLLDEVGLLTVDDPDKVHLLALPSHTPLEFKWQMYIPAGFHRNWSIRTDGGSSTSSNSGSTPVAYHDLVLARFREESDGRWILWMKHRGGSSMMNLSKREAALLLEPQRLSIRQLAQGGSTVLEDDKIHTLLRVSDAARPSENPIAELLFGSEAAFRKPAAVSSK